MTVQLIFKSFTIQNITHALKLLKSIFDQKHLSVFRYPTKIQKFTVQKSPHVHKKSREQFEIRTHKLRVSIANVTHSQADHIVQSVQSLQLLGIQLQLQTVDATELCR